MTSPAADAAARGRMHVPRRSLSPASRPLFVHCCHCTWCQRESGAAFALNAMIESERVELLSGAPELVDTPSASGAGQRIARCPRCRVAVWSHYAGAGDAVRFVRVGTLDEPGRLPPDIHIFTAIEAALGRAAGRNAARCPSTTTASSTGRRRAWRAARRMRARAGALAERRALRAARRLTRNSTLPRPANSAR